MTKAVTTLSHVVDMPQLRLVARSQILHRALTVEVVRTQNENGITQESSCATQRQTAYHVSNSGH